MRRVDNLNKSISWSLRSNIGKSHLRKKAFCTLSTGSLRRLFDLINMKKNEKDCAVQVRGEVRTRAWGRQETKGQRGHGGHARKAEGTHFPQPDALTPRGRCVLCWRRMDRKSWNVNPTTRSEAGCTK